MVTKANKYNLEKVFDTESMSVITDWSIRSGSVVGMFRGEHFSTTRVVDARPAERNQIIVETQSGFNYLLSEPMEFMRPHVALWVTSFKSKQGRDY